MLELPNFGHITISAIQFESHDKILVGDVKDINYDFITFTSKYLYFKKTYSSHFC